MPQYWAVFLPAHDPTGEQHAVSQVEQMFASRCFRASDGALGCVSCHDPHDRGAPEARDDTYRASCLECHGGKGCSLPAAERRKKSPQDSCVACHMPVKTPA